MIDDATIKRVAMESGAEAWWVSGNEDSVEFYAVLHQFARAIEQLARQEQREADARICDCNREHWEQNAEGSYSGIYDYKADAARDCAEAIRASGKGK